MKAERKNKIKKLILIAFVAMIAGFVIWNINHANAVYEKYVQTAISADAAIARSEASLGRR